MLKASQPASFGAHLRGYSQYLTYTCINTFLTTILIPLCYGESSLIENIVLIHLPMHSLYMVFQTRIFNHKIISIGIVNSCFSVFTSHTLTWTRILQFKLSIMLISLISQPCLCIFQPNACYYLSYVSSTN